MRNFKNLYVWQKSHEFVLEIYKITKDFPNEEKFGLTSQIRRATTSIALNIAEGCGRKTEKEFANFLNISFGSCSEVEYAILLCKDLNFITEKKYNDIDNKLSEIKKMFSASSSLAFANDTSEYSIHIEYSSSVILNMPVFSSTSLNKYAIISCVVSGI